MEQVIRVTSIKGVHVLPGMTETVTTTATPALVFSIYSPDLKESESGSMIILSAEKVVDINGDCKFGIL